MTAPKAISQLVEHFEQNRDALRSGRYNEAQLRQEFLNPFFAALGWDMFNEQQFSEHYKEVIHETSVEVEGAAKAPDYAFRIGGVTKFFVEAKKPSINIAQAIHPAHQVRRYAWSAKLPLAILSDFEEFAVYDCRSKPNPSDQAAVGRVLYLTYKDYIEKWDEIAAIFSKNAILKGAFDQYAQGVKGKRGTLEVDDAFLQEMEGWRETLARNLALRNPELENVRQLNYAVQMTIDRIVFLRICEDRGIEKEGQLKELLAEPGVYARLCELFRAADKRYNSGLFHFNKEKGQPSQPDDLTLTLKVDDKVLKEVICDLYYPSPYVFKLIPSDILGQVYERFLGRVIRLTPGHQAKVEEKPEVRKAGGVYYTPTYIVDYIVKNTIGKLLEGKTPPEAAQLKIVDPACGSGSFLLGAFQYLIDWHTNWYKEHEPEKWAKGASPALYRGQGGEWLLTTREKKRILLDNLHGVDIDPQAVEVTKLSLLLKVLEEESGQLSLGFERALPDLGRNIQCGNSLIGPDYYTERQLSMGFMDDEERQRVNAFDWHSAFPQVFAHGSFDAVIGNPPYVVLSEDIFQNGEITYFKKYKVEEYKSDIFHLFIQKGIDLLRDMGRLGFITPNTWFTLQFSSKLRKFVLEETEIKEIDLFEHKVFQGINVHTGLFILKKIKPQHDTEVLVKQFDLKFKPEDLMKNNGVFVKQADWAKNLGSVFGVRQIGEISDLITRIIKQNPPLSEVARASIGCQAYNSTKHTKEQILKRVFHSTEKLTEEYLPELAGNDVRRYSFERKRGKYIKYGPWLHDYRTMDWLSGPRILIREISGKWPYRIHACYIEDVYCNYKTILNVNPSQITNFSMKYLLGILNSRLISFIFPYVSNKLVTETFPRLSVRDIKKLPIRSISIIDQTDIDLHNQMIGLVDSMVALNKRISKIPQEKEQTDREICETNKQIDALVYELYGLTEEEIMLVEGKFPIIR